MKIRFLWVAVLGWVIWATAIAAQAGTTLTWYGHSAFGIVTPKGRVLLIDPWISNPRSPYAGKGEDPLSHFKRVDYILVTHAHFDAVGDAVALAKRTGARLVALADLAAGLQKVLGYPAAQVGQPLLVKPGDEARIAGGEVTVTLAPAQHAITMTLAKTPQGPGQAGVEYGLEATGFVIAVQGGPTFYHSGDTAYSEDIVRLVKGYAPDVALLNIDPHYGLTPEQAAQLAKGVGARLVVPHHYNTFEVLKQDPAPYVEALSRVGLAVKVLEPGDPLRFTGRALAR